MLRPALLLLALTACHDPAPDDLSEDSAGRDQDSVPVVDSATDSGGESAGDSAVDTAPDSDAATDTSGWVEEGVGDMDDDLDSWIFSDTVVHRIDITLPQRSVDAIWASPYDSAPGDVTFDDEPVPDIGVRLRGKIGSFRDLNGKPKFELTFNEFVQDQRFYGLESINLNNEVVDCSFMKEALGYRVFKLAGVPAERTGFARVTVNGADYGLYVLVEDPDDRFLKRTYPLPDGNLYDGKYVWYGGWNYILLDFNSGVDDYFQLEEGTDVGLADIYGVSAAIASSAGSGAFERGMSAVLDWDEYHRELAVEQWIGHNDGYALNQNNYRVYFDPTDGKAEIVPWDLDYAFLHDSDWGMNWATPRGQIAAWCFRDRTCTASSKAAMADVVAAIDPEALLTWFNSTAEVIRSDAMADPRKECSSGSVAPNQDALRAWISGGNEAVSTWWDL